MSNYCLSCLVFKVRTPTYLLASRIISSFLLLSSCRLPSAPFFQSRSFCILPFPLLLLLVLLGEVTCCEVASLETSVEGVVPMLDANLPSRPYRDMSVSFFPALPPPIQLVEVAEEFAPPPPPVLCRAAAAAALPCSCAVMGSRLFAAEDEEAAGPPKANLTTR